MKTIRKYMLIAMISSIAVTATAQKSRKKVDLLEITGAALLNDQRASDYAISVYLDGTKIDSMFTKSKKTIKFYVKFDNVYTFLFQKENCVDKIVIVNTQIPKGLKSMEDDSFDFEVEMSQSLSKGAKDLEDYPVAVLYIDKKEEALQASADYNKFTHSNADVIKSEVEHHKTKKVSDR
jgi:hypothetical protein